MSASSCSTITVGCSIKKNILQLKVGRMRMFKRLFNTLTHLPTVCGFQPFATSHFQESIDALAINCADKCPKKYINSPLQRQRQLYSNNICVFLL